MRPPTNNWQAVPASYKTHAVLLTYTAKPG